MSNTVQIQWDGMDELKTMLRSLPSDLTGAAIDLVNEAAEAAQTEIAAGYHQGPTGNLRAGLGITFKAGLFKTVAVLRNRAAHAWLWDNGSQLRHYAGPWKHGKATGAMWGKTGPPHTFVKGVIKHRRLMYERFKDLLRDHGLLVTGEAA